MELSSHNSWSFNKVKEWYLRPFSKIAKCQKHEIGLQYLDGVRCFDLRLRYNFKEQIYETAHGAVTYDGGEKWKEDLNLINEHIIGKEPVYCRVLLEDRKQDTCEEQDKKFAEICEWLENTYENIKFWGGWPAHRRWGYMIYNFHSQEPSVEEKYSSVVPPKIRGLYPYLYAKNNNKELIKKGTDKDFLMLDFVNIKE